MVLSWQNYSAEKMPSENSYLNEVLILKSYADVATLAAVGRCGKAAGGGLRRRWI
jgi:hypothetical protein